MPHQSCANGILLRISIFFLRLDYTEYLNGQADDTINVPNEDNKQQEHRSRRQEPAVNMSKIRT